MAQLLGVKKVPPTPVIVEYVDLRLTGDEVNFLYDVLCVVGGSPSNSRRRHAAAIHDALREEVFPGRDFQRQEDMDGRLYFRKEL